MHQDAAIVPFLDAERRAFVVVAWAPRKPSAVSSCANGLQASEKCVNGAHLENLTFAKPASNSEDNPVCTYRVEMRPPDILPAVLQTSVAALLVAATPETEYVNEVGFTKTIWISASHTDAAALEPTTSTGPPTE
jgi:hypothetical protein